MTSPAYGDSPPPLRCDVAILVYSRDREDCLTRLLADLDRDFVPALGTAGLTSCIWIYAQAYGADYLAGLRLLFADRIAAGGLVLVESIRPHRTIGEVAHAAVRSVQDGCEYKLAMLMDDDSIFTHDPRVADNLRQAAHAFIAGGHRAYSIKLGASDTLAYRPFLDPNGPIMPFREKMLWASRAVLDEVLALPRFAELAIGEDAVIAALAWLGGPERCFGVDGMATFLHLGFEQAEEFGDRTFAGGYAALMQEGAGASACKYEAALRGVTPHHVLPHVFVGVDHPHFAYNGVRADLFAAIMGGAATGS